MKTRVKTVRKDAQLNQDQFAERLNLSKNFVSLIETGARIPSDRTIADICEKFSVNETWLRTGEGEPYKPRSRRAEIHAHVTQAISGDNEFQKALIDFVATRPPDEIAAMLKNYQDFAEILKKT